MFDEFIELLNLHNDSIMYYFDKSSTGERIVIARAIAQLSLHEMVDQQ